MTRFFIIPIRMWRVLEPQLAAGALILFTPLLVNDQRKVPLSAFGRVRDDTVLIFNSNSPLAEFGMTPFFIFNSNSLVAEFGMTPLCGT